ncbi:MAG: amidase domain-containing protein [Clostridium sp.]
MKIFKKLFVFIIIFTLTTPLFGFILDDPLTSTLNDFDEVSNNIELIELKEQFTPLLINLFKERNQSVMSGDGEKLKEFYDFKINVSKWAYESEWKKTEYLRNWGEKQAIEFTNIDSIIHIRKIKERSGGIYGIMCDVATTFSYTYVDSPETINNFRLGTNHYLNIRRDGDKFTITKEWYTDPFADSLDLNKLKSDEMREYFLSKKAPDLNPNKRLQSALNYAHTYCGVSENAEFTFKYNPKYKNFNPDGGDCANFASQILHEGGGFKKNPVWNCDGKSATKSWVNAQGFKNYMVGSGRASYIAQGKYKEIYKVCYNMRPGDFVAYEKKGKIVHISTVTGLDSKGYPLVTCHNTDRLLVPFDLGWSNEEIRFHLVHVHY